MLCFLMCYKFNENDPGQGKINQFKKQNDRSGKEKDNGKEI